MNSWSVDPDHPNTAEKLICMLSAMCDGASSIDSAGFSLYDSSFGHSLANQARKGRPWTEKQASAAVKLIVKYQRQLGGEVFIENWLKKPVFSQKPCTVAATKQVVCNRGDAIFKFNYDNSIISDIKTIRGSYNGVKFYSKWDPNSKVWSVPINEASIGQILSVAKKHQFDIDKELEANLGKVDEAIEESQVMLTLNDNRHIMINDGHIDIYCTNYNIIKEFERELSLNGIS